MIVIAGSCLVPIISTLQEGVTRTERFTHYDNLRMFARSKLNECIADGAYNKLPIIDASGTIPWPPEDDIQLATYAWTVEIVESFQLATLTSAIGGDFNSPNNIIGTQPRSLKLVVVTYAEVPDGDDPAAVDFDLTLCHHIRLSALIAFPHFALPHRVYVSDPVNIRIYGIDTLTGNVVENFQLPYFSMPLSASANDGYRPGNIAVHPNNKWLAIQTRDSIKLLDIAVDSPNQGAVVSVFSDGEVYLESPSNIGEIREDRGIAFRSDGRFCYVTKHNAAQILSLQVPNTFGPPFTFDKAFTVSNKIVGFKAEQDGYLYLIESGNKIKRLNMYVASTSQVIETVSLPSTSPLATASVTVTRDGRNILGVWNNQSNVPIIALLSSSVRRHPDVLASAVIRGDIADLNGGLCYDITASPRGDRFFIPTKHADNKGCIYSISLPFDGPKITTWNTASNSYVKADVAETRLSQAVVSPTFTELVVDRDTKGEALVLPIDQMTPSGTLHESSVPSDMKAVYNPGISAANVAARTPELILVGCDDGAGKGILEVVDLYGQFVHENLRTRFDHPVTHISMDAGGGQALISLDQPSTLWETIDVFAGKKTGNFPPAWSFTADKTPVRSVITLEGNRIAVMRSITAPVNNGYNIMSPTGVPLSAFAFATTTAMLDSLPLNYGGTLLLSSDAVQNCAILDWVGPDAKKWASWDSRYDDFPPLGATKMAVSADDSLMAFFNPISQELSCYEFRTQNFATLTMQLGLICDYRSGGSFLESAVPSAYRMTTPGGYSLFENFTCNDNNSSMQLWPGNFHYLSPTTSKYGGGDGTDSLGYAAGCRFFGYYYPEKLYKNIALAVRDGGRVWLNDEVGEVNWGGGGDAVETVSIDMDSIRSLKFQLNHSSNFDLNVGLGAFVTLSNIESPETGTANIDVPNNKIQSLNLPPEPGFTWDKIPASDTRPLRFAPQRLFSFALPGLSNHHFVYSRNIASPTLYFIADDTNTNFFYFTLDGYSSHNILAGIPTGSVNSLAISPDGHRLILSIAEAGNQRVDFVDIAEPRGSNYGKVVGSVSLTNKPISLAVRPFNNYTTNTASGTFKDLNLLFGDVCGNNIAAVASGGIYIIGGGTENTFVATTTIWRFNPYGNQVDNLGSILEKPVRDHSVVSYDGELVVLNGTSGTTFSDATDWVQKWNPTTGSFFTSQDELEGGTGRTRVSPKMRKNSGDPSPYVVTASGYTSDLYPYQAFDQKKNTWRYSGSGPGWVMLNYGHSELSMPVNRIVIDNKIKDSNGSDDEGVRDFELWGGISAPDDYGCLFSGTVPKGSKGYVVDFNNSTRYQYYKFKVLNNHGSGSRTGVREIELWVNGVTMVQPKMKGVNNPQPLKQSSQDASDKAGWKIYDGKDNKEWEATSAGSAASMEWVAVELANPEAVNLIQVLSEDDSHALKKFSVYGANDLASYTALTAGRKSDAYITGLGWDPLYSCPFDRPKRKEWFSYSFINSNMYKYYLIAGYSYGDDLEVREVELFNSVALMQAKTKGEMAKTFLDDVTADPNTVKRCSGAAALTPYGIITSGGLTNTGTVTPNTQVYWPHIIPEFVEQAPFGLYGEYYSIPYFVAGNLGDPGPANAFIPSNLFATRVDKIIDSNTWGGPSPYIFPGSHPIDYFAIRWTGYLIPEHTETYTFRSTSDDGARLWVNNKLIVDQWIKQTPTTTSGLIDLKAGEIVPIVYEFYQDFGGVKVSLEWSSPSQSLQIIPAERLRTSQSFGKYGMSRELPSQLSGGSVHHNIVYHKGYLYRVGGSSDGGTTPLPNVHRFTFETNTWDPVVPGLNGAEVTAFKRTQAGACSFGDEIFLFGGVNGATTLTNAVAWNPTTNSVRILANIPPYSGNNYTRKMCAVPYGPHIYLFGGARSDGTTKGRVLRFTP